MGVQRLLKKHLDLQSKGGNDAKMNRLFQDEVVASHYLLFLFLFFI